MGIYSHGVVMGTISSVVPVQLSVVAMCACATQSADSGAAQLGAQPAADHSLVH